MGGVKVAMGPKRMEWGAWLHRLSALCFFFCSFPPPTYTLPMDFRRG